jgi:hypothetical protein
MHQQRPHQPWLLQACGQHLVPALLNACIPLRAQVGVFQMGEGGLQAVPNPSASFLGDRAMGANAHSAVTVMLEGTRPLLLEVQALCSPVHQARSVLCYPSCDCTSHYYCHPEAMRQVRTLKRCLVMVSP